MIMKYKEIGSMAFQNLLQTIRAAKTSNINACTINRIWKQVKAARELMQEQYKSEIMEVYAKRDESGTILFPEGQNQGFVPMEDKAEEFMAAQDAFGEKEYTFTCSPFNPTHLSDVKLSAQDIETLGVLFEEKATPSIPTSVGF